MSRLDDLGWEVFETFDEIDQWAKEMELHLKITSQLRNRTPDFERRVTLLHFLAKEMGITFMIEEMVLGHKSTWDGVWNPSIEY
ncbi:hypothetical protein [Thalassospira alkalitolerans]|uniref:hypothetical protein n=1 Tax=Thalassospira alkalitolerans TaxID=1293890 RepID=UPI0030EEC24D|tara:strand:- start:2538 stop:2789 length:252 start_codon:yes stop_codon:yes gene_type:complete